MTSPTKPDIEPQDELEKLLIVSLGSLMIRSEKPPTVEEIITAIKPTLSTLIANKQLEELNFILDNASGGGSWRRVIIGRISELTKKGKA